MQRGLQRLVFVGLIGVMAVGILVPPPAKASTLSDLLKKQADLQQQAADSKKKIQQKQAQANDIQQTIQDINDNITATENRIANSEQQIALTTQVIDQLNSQITDQQTKLDDFNNRLKSAYVNLYELSQTSPLEVLLQSDSLNDLVSHTQYVQAIQTQLQSNITEVNSLLDDLSSKKDQNQQQKASLEALHSQLASDEASLTRQKQQQASLLSLTQGQAAQYQDLLTKLQAEQENLSQQIYDARRALAGNEGLIFGTGGYPWPDEPNPYAADPWLFIKRQCTSFAAWKFGNYFGEAFVNTRPGQGSAWNWPALAHDQGYSTSSTPVANSVVSWPASNPNIPNGHVAWVMAVNNDGTIDVAEYNWAAARSYDERKSVNPYRYGTPTFIKG